MIRSVTLAAVLALFAAEAAQAAAPPRGGRPAPQAQPQPEQSSYGYYLSGRLALASGDTREAALRLADAAQKDPGDRALRERAFTVSILAGEIDMAARLIPDEGDPNGRLQGLGRLALASSILAQGRARDARAALDQPAPLTGTHAGAADLLRPWVLASAGDWTGALAPTQSDDPVVRAFAALARARLLERRGRTREAEAAYAALTVEPQGAALFFVAHGEFLERRGRRDDALALYAAALAQAPQDPALLAAQARAEARGRPPAALDVGAGAAESLVGASAAKLGRREGEFWLAYLRLALRLDPTNAQALLWMGEAMTQAGDGESARRAWGAVTEQSPLWLEARSRLATSLAGDERTDEALAVARQVLDARPESDEAALTLADLYREQQRWDDSAAVLRPRLDGPAGEDWRVRFLLGAVLERAGRWSEAEPQLVKALALKPDDPDVQNYLGYSWIDRGEKVAEGMALVEKALAARPQSAAFLDSLAWGWFRKGQYAKAVEMLERAVEQEPGDPEINDHLGDAYWMVGRRREAQFQWRHVLTLDPDAARRATVERKLSEGLTPQ